MESATDVAQNNVLSLNTFRAIASRHAAQADLDEGDDNIELTSFKPVTIQQLFDFHATFWVEAYGKHARYGFNEELTLYELLGLDAEGEGDGGEDEIDASMEDILIG